MCDRDQWDIHKLDKKYDCYVHAPPRLSTITLRTQFSAEIFDIEDKVKDACRDSPAQKDPSLMSVDEDIRETPKAENTPYGGGKRSCKTRQFVIQLVLKFMISFAFRLGQRYQAARLKTAQG